MAPGRANGALRGHVSERGGGELFKSGQGSNPPVWVIQYLRHYFVFGEVSRMPCARLALMPLDVSPLASKFDIDFRIHPK
jgi:hypothetical protein